MFAIKTMTSLVFKINGNNKNIEIDLIEVLLQLGVIGSKVLSPKTVSIYLVYCFIIFVLKVEYPLICCRKYFEYL